MIIFGAAQLLPGDLGRSVLGRDASAEAVAEYNQRARDRSLRRRPVPRLGEWRRTRRLRHFARAARATRVGRHRAGAPQLAEARRSSPSSSCVPFGILGGVLAGLRAGKATDRGITVVGLSLAVVPEFVTGLVLILVFSIWAGWLPVTAQWEPGAGPLTQVKHLTLPAIALTLVLFGYIARITRAGVVEASTPTTRGRRISKGCLARRSYAGTCSATPSCRRSPSSRPRSATSSAGSSRSSSSSTTAASG